MSHHPRRPHEGVIIDDIAEERLRRAQALEEDFPGSRNIPSTGLKVPTTTKKVEDRAAPDADKVQDQDTGKEEKAKS